MTSKNSLKDDIDLMKDFESLKLKQMILIESLKNNKNSNKKDELIQSLYDSFKITFNSRNKNYEDLEQLNIYNRIENIEKNIEKILSLLEEKSVGSSKKDKTSEEGEVEKSPPLPKF